MIIINIFKVNMCSVLLTFATEYVSSFYIEGQVMFQNAPPNNQLGQGFIQNALPYNQLLRLLLSSLLKESLPKVQLKDPPALQSKEYEPNLKLKEDGSNLRVKVDQQNLLNDALSSDNGPEFSNPSPLELFEEDSNPSPLGLFEGDIELSKDQREAVLKHTALHEFRWPDGDDGYPYVPYIFKGAVKQTPVLEGISHWMEHTCIRFEQINEISSPHLTIYDGGGCRSGVGRDADRNGQRVSISEQCSDLGTVVHELGHALGLWHEQSRPERDNYVVLVKENIKKEKLHDFDQEDIQTFGVAYDYSSDLHYHSRAFSSNGKLTLLTKNPLDQEIIGRRKGLSHRDKILANKIYKCFDKWLSACSLSYSACQNEGYIGSECICVCPPHASGDRCQNVDDGIYAPLRSKLTEEIFTEKQLAFDTVSGLKFTKYILAPECMRPRVVFERFLLSKTPFKDGRACKYEFLNIRTGENMYSGDVYCGKMIKSGQVFESSTREMVLFSYSKNNPNFGSNWSAEVTFVKSPNCTKS